jgi:predicted MFS family arabinose efflux permease
MTTASPPVPWRLQLLVPALVVIAMTAVVVSSLGAPLIPTLAGTQHVSLPTAQWSLTITLLVGAIATPTMGRLGDGPHRRQVIVGGLAVVVVGSLLAALPLSFGWLLVGRGLQGIGLGLIPLTIATARDALPPERSRSAVALLSIATVAGIGLGYPVTGVIAEHLGYHAGFWFGAAVVAVALAVAAVVLPSSAGLPANPLDTIGALLLGGGLLALLLALSEAESWGWTSVRLLGLAAVTVVLFATWVVHELRTPYPLIDLRLVRHRAVLTANVMAVCVGVGVYLLIATIVRYVQTPASAGYGFGSSILGAGLVLLPFSATSVAASRFAPFLARRTTPAAVLPVGCVMFLLAMLTFAFARGSLWQAFVTMAVAGLGVGCTFAAMPGMIVRAVPPQETGSAMSFNQVLRYVGYSVGSVLSATILEAHTTTGRPLPSSSGYGAVALVGVVVLAVSTVLSVALPLGERSATPDQVLVDESIADGLPYEEPYGKAYPERDLAVD